MISFQRWIFRDTLARDEDLQDMTAHFCLSDTWLVKQTRVFGPVSLSNEFPPELS